jgi:hypothetical protein
VMGEEVRNVAGTQSMQGVYAVTSRAPAALSRQCPRRRELCH